MYMGEIITISNFHISDTFHLVLFLILFDHSCVENRKLANRNVEII